MLKTLPLKSILFKINFISIILLLLFSTEAFSQNVIKENYQYLSPLPNAILVQPKTTIIIREGNYIDKSSLNNNFIEVKGNKSGMHPGNLILSDDGKTIIFKPHVPFLPDEKVTVNINKGIKTINGYRLKHIEYSFSTITKVISQKIPVLNTFLNSNNRYKAERQNLMVLKKPGKISLEKDSLVPPDLPGLTIAVNNHPSQGDIFTAPFNFSINQYGYLMIFDNNAVPVFYKRFNYDLFDFKKQPGGSLTYFDYHSLKFFFMDSSYTIYDSISAGNGLGTDLHELRVLPDGHILLLASDYAIVNMDTVVPGGNPHALVKGMAIQEFDNNKNVIFQWRTFDHFKITDATPDINLKDSIIDYVHANAIDVDTDGNLLLSSRHMDEVTKINRQTGDIIWRWGGEYCKNNQFTFINDPNGFSHQHDIRRLPNGNLTVFDNGNLKSPKFSRACEYQMDEPNKIVNMVWEYTNDPQTYTFAMGDVQRLSDHHTIIGWGANDGPPSVSEVKADGSLAWAVLFPDSIINYRAFKFNWRTNYFVTNPDSMSFINVLLGSSDTANFTVTNNSDSTLLINEIYSSDSAIILQQSPPFSIPAHADTMLSVKFEPLKEGQVTGWIYLRSNRYSEMIAQTLFVRGTTDSVFTSVGNENLVKKFKLYQNYPNPFNPTTTISYVIPFNGTVKLKVYDILGREVARLINGEKHQGMHKVVFNASNFASGVYFYRIEVTKTGNSNIRFEKVKKLLLIK